MNATTGITAKTTAEDYIGEQRRLTLALLDLVEKACRDANVTIDCCWHTIDVGFNKTTTVDQMKKKIAAAYVALKGYRAGMSEPTVTSYSSDGKPNMRVEAGGRAYSVRLTSYHANGQCKKHDEK